MVFFGFSKGTLMGSRMSRVTTSLRRVWFFLFCIYILFIIPFPSFTCRCALVVHSIGIYYVFLFVFLFCFC